MGASISFDSKYRLILDTEVECVSLNPPSDAPKKKQSGGDRKNNDRESVSDGSRSDGSDDGDSSSSSGSDTDDDTNKTYTVKITPEIASYIRSWIRKTPFLDEFDLITEIDLDNYNHAPGSALVFNSDSVVFNTSNQTIESLGDWEYIPPEQPANSSKSKSKSKSKKRRADDSDSNSDSDSGNAHGEKSQYKTKDDDLPVSEIEHILKEKFEEYNKTREFVIHESKNTFLCLKINSVEIVKA
jgi:hypothetical protein